ncbi:MAG: chromosomal replication initiator protein DnaA [Phycisphaerae bacterium]|nr:chromosomal replication initiator protein DnaA [Phycisphaerae bacterium]NIP52376.1 chromosomal replication initiator protein DnaA [Phycisphaerae bacterium]NIS51372.1 chromosomal replication initiator protein DnaA [Phycisphaerae bacterium]NIU08987.1 chromosomal replication initiator protein DnaA [Phycisphaerae bacterium]NIU56647.1 chromosomal replication initiator protein DnaA [Phycisphaerae bacterium]
MQGTIRDEQARSTGTEISAINEVLARKVGPQKYRIWFKNSTKMSLADGYLKVGVPNLFIASWIENHFSNQISQAVREVAGSRPKITFTIDPELSGSMRRNQLDSQAQLVDRAQNRLDTTRTKAKPASTKRLHFSLDTFVVGTSNQLAFNAAKAVVEEKNCPFNPLFIHGGYGVGKTHLLQGICNAVCSKRPQTNWLYLSAEDFVNQFVLALKTKKLEAFRRRMRQTDLLAIDDIHFLASKPSTQEEFLHTFNTINLAGKQVVLASDAHPKMIGQLSEKLVNRFVSGMVVKIQNPDFNTRCQICRQYAEKLAAENGRLKIGRGIPESVIKYIAENLRTNVRELEGALLKLIAYSALQNKKINLAMAQAVLAEHLERCDPIVHISDIESAVATYFGITPANIHSSKKDRTVALARHFSMYLTRKHTKMSSSEVGRFMGNKNHATVLLGCRRIESLIERNAEIYWNGPAGNKVAKARTILSNLEESISR